MFNNVTVTDVKESASVENKLATAFYSDDKVNCPCVSYKIEKTVDLENNKTLTEDIYGYKFSIDDSGIFKYENYTTYHKFYLWISCKNSAGNYTGTRERPNI